MNNARSVTRLVLFEIGTYQITDSLCNLFNRVIIRIVVFASFHEPSFLFQHFLSPMVLTEQSFQSFDSGLPVRPN